MVGKEGEKAKCRICKKDITEDIFWTIERYEKEVPIYSCPICGKPIRIEYFPETASFEIRKPCTCTVRFSEEILHPSRPRWKTVRYLYCDDCFKKAYGNILFERLGEDKDDKEN